MTVGIKVICKNCGWECSAESINRLGKMPDRCHDCGRSKFRVEDDEPTSEEPEEEEKGVLDEHDLKNIEERERHKYR